MLALGGGATMVKTFDTDFYMHTSIGGGPQLYTNLA